MNPNLNTLSSINCLSTIGKGLSSLLMGLRIIPKASSVVAPSKKFPSLPIWPGLLEFFPCIRNKHFNRRSNRFSMAKMYPL